MDRGEQYGECTDFIDCLLHGGKNRSNDEQRQIQGDAQEGARIFFTLMFIGMVMVETKSVHGHHCPHKQQGAPENPARKAHSLFANYAASSYHNETRLISLMRIDYHIVIRTATFLRFRFPFVPFRAIYIFGFSRWPSGEIH